LFLEADPSRLHPAFFARHTAIVPQRNLYGREDFIERYCNAKANQRSPIFQGYGWQKSGVVGIPVHRTAHL
jgi:hypothetical protein